MQDQFTQFTTKKNLASLLVLAILVLAIPLGVNLVRQQQTLKSRASGEQINFASPGIDNARTLPNGSPVTVAVAQTIGLNLGIPTGWSYSATPTPTPTPPTVVYAELVRYYSFGKTDNWSTTSLQNTNYPSPPASGYGKSESQGYILANDDGSGNVTPLYDCLEKSKPQGDHSEEAGDCDASKLVSGTESKTKIGYIYKSPQTNSTAIRHCFDTSNGDSFLFIGAACNSKYRDGGDVLVGYSLNSIPSGPKPPTPTVDTSSACLLGGKPFNLKISWTPGSNVNTVDISNKVNFGLDFYHKVNLTDSGSTTAPDGFFKATANQTELVFQQNTTYYTRLWNGKWSSVVTFLVPGNLIVCQ